MKSSQRIIGIIQARMGSTRLPNKMLLHLHGFPIIEWVIRRVMQSNDLDDIVVAIPDTAKNDVLNHFLKKKLNVNVYRGTEEDVLNRFLCAAQLLNATHVVRICADNPLVSGSVIDELIRFYFKSFCDYAYNQGDNGKTNNYPDGFGAEIVSFELLKWLEVNTTEKRHREHCLSYISDNPNQFTNKTFNSPDERIARPWLKLDLDTYEDYMDLMLKDFKIDSSPLDIVQLFSE
jgi:spore coat polysaccharide biosynthesis protein SpsF